VQSAPYADVRSASGRISFDKVPEVPRRLEEGGLDGRLALCPEG